MYLLTWHQTTCTYKKSSKVLRIGISSNIKVNGTIILGITAPNWDYLFIIAIKKEQKVDVEKSTWVCNSCTFGISKSFQQKKGYLSCIKGGNTWWIEKKMIGQNWIRRSNFYKRIPTYFQHMNPPISKIMHTELSLALLNMSWRKNGRFSTHFLSCATKWLTLSNFECIVWNICLLLLPHQGN